MGDYTLEDFEDEIRFGLGGRGDQSPSVTTTRVRRWVNDIYRMVTMPPVLATFSRQSGMYRHMNLEVDHELTLSTDTMAYSLTSGVPSSWDGFYQIYSVVYWATSDTIDLTSTVPTERHKRLEPETYRNILDTSVWSSGEPRAWARWRTLLYVDRRPSSSENGNKLTVHGYIRPAAMTSASGTTLLDAEWDPIITQGAIWRGWDRLNQPDLAEEAREEFSRMVNAVVDLHEADAEDYPHRMHMSGHDQSMMSGRSS